MEARRIELVTTNESIEFTQLAHALTYSSVIGLDAEWKPNRQPSTFPTVSLLQIACLGADVDESTVFLVDLQTLKLKPVYELLRQVIVAPDVIKLGLGFRQDLVYLSYTFRQQGFDAGFQIVEPYIDINAIYYDLLPEQLGREMSKQSKSLATICEEILGITLSKEQQCSDWSLRPLTEEQKIYAALDVVCLLQIFNVFQQANVLSNQNKDCPSTSDLGVSNGCSMVTRTNFCEAVKMICTPTPELCDSIEANEEEVDPLKPCKAIKQMDDALVWIIMKHGDKISLKDSDKWPRALKKKGKKSAGRLQSKGKTLEFVEDWQGPPPWDPSVGGDGCAKFLCDFMFKGLANHLRCVGLDAAVPNSKRRDTRDLIDQARKEKRVILTQDAKLFRQEYLIKNQMYMVKSLGKKAQQLEVIKTFRLKISENQPNEKVIKTLRLKISENQPIETGLAVESHEHVNGGSDDQDFIKYIIPDGIMKNADIDKLYDDCSTKSWVILKRDVEVSIRAHMSRLNNINQETVNVERVVSVGTHASQVQPNTMQPETMQNEIAQSDSLQNENSEHQSQQSQADSEKLLLHLNAQAFIESVDKLCDKFVYNTKKVRDDMDVFDNITVNQDLTKSASGSAAPASSSHHPFHPAFAVPNIRNGISVLDQEDGQYLTWSELFTIQARAYNVLDHIDETNPRPPDIDDATWKRLDAIVKQWIYSTISKDLANTIMKKDATALELWTRLEEVFQDNKPMHALKLGIQFKNIRLDMFENMTAYCKEVKLVADQLANVDDPVTEKTMVLQLIDGLPKGEYDTISTVLQQSDPFPSFTKAISQLLLEESRRAMHEDQASLVTTNHSNVNEHGVTVPPPQVNQSRNNKNNNGGGRGKSHGTGNSSNKGKGKGKSTGRSTNSQAQQQHQQQAWPNSAPQRGPSPVQQWVQPGRPNPQPWISPPCPYPSYGPNYYQQQRPRTLGSRRRPMNQKQAYIAPHNGPYSQPMTLTDLGNAFNTMHLQQPDDNWYMDTGATSHLANNAGSSYGENLYEMQ